MKITKSSLPLQSQPTTVSYTAPDTAYSSSNDVNVNMNIVGQATAGNEDFSSYNLELDASGSSGGESLTLYKSDFDETSVCEVTIGGGGVITQSTPSSYTLNNSTSSNDMNLTWQDQAMSSRSVENFDCKTDISTTELQRAMVKTPRKYLKRVRSVNETFTSSAPVIPTFRNQPKYQFDVSADFPSYHQNTATANTPSNVLDNDSALFSPPTKKIVTPRKSKDTSNVSTPGPAPAPPPSSSSSFTISIPSTSRSPATTMYLPFTKRKLSLKSHELESNNFNFVRQSENDEELKARRSRISRALDDEESGPKTIKYFADQNIEEYLEKRGYLQPYLRVPKIITKGIFASIISLENSISNSVLFGPQYEAHEIIGEIEKFWTFYLGLKETNPSMSAELKPVLIPMLLYFYLECFVSGLVPVALRLYVEFSKKFLTEDATQESYDILFSIATITSPDAFDDNELLQAFRRQEYRFVLSSPTFERLKKFVISCTCPLMLHLFSSRFTIQMKDSAVVAETYVEHPWEEPQKNRRDSDSRVAAVIRQLRETVDADLPSLSLYLIDGSPISGAISPLGSTFAFGMAAGEGIRFGFVSQAALDTTIEESSDTALEMMNHLTGHSGSVYSLAFHPRTKWLFSAGQDCTMRVWDLNKLTSRAIYRGHSLPIGALDIAESGVMLATGSIDTTARIWLPERTNYVRLLAGHYLHVTAVKFHPNEAYIATGSLDTSARLWSVSDGSMVRVFTGFQGRITSIVFHDSGKFLIGGGFDPVIRVWDIGEGEILTELPCPPNCTSITLNGNLLAASFEFSKVRLWNLQQVLNTSSNYTEDSEDSEQGFEPPRPAKVLAISNSLLKLHFSNPKHIMGLGEEYTGGNEQEEPVNDEEEENEEEIVQHGNLPFRSKNLPNRLENAPALFSNSDEEDAFSVLPPLSD